MGRWGSSAILPVELSKRGPETESTYEEGDGTIEIGKEDVLGVGVLEVRHDC